MDKEHPASPAWSMEEIYNMVLRGLDNNILQIYYDDSDQELCCECGDACFYFADTTAEKYTSAEDYIKNTDIQDIARSITETIHDYMFADDPNDGEGLYVMYYLEERLAALDKTKKKSKDSCR